jgi:hypothetical protein
MRSSRIVNKNFSISFIRKVDLIFFSQSLKINLKMYGKMKPMDSIDPTDEFRIAYETTGKKFR